MNELDSVGWVERSNRTLARFERDTHQQQRNNETLMGIAHGSRKCAIRALHPSYARPLLASCGKSPIPLASAPSGGGRTATPFAECRIAMAKEELLEFPGVVTELLPNATFRVKLENEHEIIAHTAGRMRKNRIRVL